MLTGQVLPRRSKQDFADDIATAVGLPKPEVSGGATVESKFLRDVLEHQTGERSNGNTYEIASALLEHFGLTYDPHWDSSESAGKGGGTVTIRTFSRLRSAILREPRCFILNISDSSRGAAWQSDFERGYAYASTVTSAKRLNEAGPGSRVVFYSTANSRTHRKQFIASAQVDDIASGWTGPWHAFFTDLRRFETPVLRSEVTIHGHNRQHAIVEIEPALYEGLVTSGGSALPNVLRATLEDGSGTERTLARALAEMPPKPLPIVIPEIEHADFHVSPPLSVEYREDRGTLLPPTSQGWTEARRRDSKNNRAIETAAISQVLAAMAADGWLLVRDRQADGCGYDLEYRKQERTLHVEVKGIASSILAFNVTPKEFWRARTDPSWVLMAVQNVSRPANIKITTLSRRQISEASRAIVGYRVRM